MNKSNDRTVIIANVINKPHTSSIAVLVDVADGSEQIFV
jgi:hypothetical protein